MVQKPGSSRIGSTDELSVEDERNISLFAQPLEHADDGGELRCLIVPEPRPQTHETRAFVRLDLGDRPDAVVFGFVDERRANERRLRKRRQHGLERVGCRSPARKCCWRANGLFRR